MEEDVFDDYVTEVTAVAPEPTIVPETVDNVDTGAEAYDFKEYDLKEYDLGEVDNRLYDYGAYDEYGTAPSKPTAAYDDEVGPGVAAETDVSESTVSTTPWPGDWGVCAWTARARDSFCLLVHAFLVGCLAWEMCHWHIECGVSKCLSVLLLSGTGDLMTDIYDTDNACISVLFERA